MKYKCAHCQTPYSSPYTKHNPPPAQCPTSDPFHDGELTIKKHLLCRCGKPIGILIFGCNDPGLMSRWHYFPELQIEEQGGMDWIEVCRQASSNYVDRVGRIMNKVQELEEILLRVDEILNQIRNSKG